MAGQKCSNKQYGSETNEKLKLETLVRSVSVGGNLQTKIHVINCLRIKDGWKSSKKVWKVEKFKKRQLILLNTHFARNH